MTLMVIKRRTSRVDKPFNDDRLIKKLRDDIIQGNITDDTRVSEEQLAAMLEMSLQNGEISEETYNYIINNNFMENPEIKNV